MAASFRGSLRPWATPFDIATLDLAQDLKNIMTDVSFHLSQFKIGPADSEGYSL